MKKIIKYIVLLIILIGCVVALIFCFNKLQGKNLLKNLKDIDWIRENVNISLSDNLGNNIYEVEKNDNISIFNELYQSVIDEKIKYLYDETYDFESPLLVLNPYGTNNLGLNIYFTTEKEMEITYTISVDNEEIPDFQEILKNETNSNYTTDHKYQIIGLVPEEINNIKLVGKTSDGENFETNFTIDMTEVKCNSDTILENVSGSSDRELTNGLFVLFGLDKAFNANNYIYDNNGILRADLVLNEYRSDRIIFSNDKMYYSYDTNKIGVINKLGKIENTYNLDGYTMHHDYILDEDNNKLLVLVNSDKEEDSTIEDLIISVDIESGNIEEIVDMKDLLPSIYETAEMPESGKNTYGGTGLDWIHLNSLSIIDGKEDIVVSGREISTIIYIEDIYKEPKVKYLIADDAVYEDTEYNDLVLEKIGDFVNQAGQHTITYVDDSSLDDGQYYLEMYNNNYGASNTRKDFPWDEYEGVGTYTEGEKSKYYKYLIDENEGSYELIEEFNVAYSSIVSSVQDVGDNHITSSGKSNCYAEYDESGELIKQFNYTSKKYAYRVFKYDFSDIWFK